jgi:hypothetical protein
MSGQRVVLRETDPTNQGDGQIVSAVSGEACGIYGVDFATNVTLSEMLLGVDAFIVKVDVEGHEGKFLYGAKEWMCGSVVRHVIVEMSDTTKKNPRLLEIFKFMRSAGYWMMDVAVGSSEIESVDVGLWPPNLIFTLISDHAMC